MVDVQLPYLITGRYVENIRQHNNHLSEFIVILQLAGDDSPNAHHGGQGRATVHFRPSGQRNHGHAHLQTVV
jgi:hypothetical protein